MPDKLHKYICRECGADYEKQREQRNGRCPDCAMKAVGEAATQMMRMSGPYYDRWRVSMEECADRASEGIKRFLAGTKGDTLCH